MTEHPIRAIRRAGVPLACFETVDPALSIRATVNALNGKADTTAILSWDIAQGITGLNTLGKALAADLSPEGAIQSSNPFESLSLLRKAPEDTLCFWHNAQNYIQEPTVKQALWNLRDAWKANGSTLIMLAPAMVLPDELKNDVVCIGEALPDMEEIKAIVASICEDAKLDAPAPDVISKAADALLGLSAFAAEQCLAMSISKSGLDLPNLWERKRAFIRQVDGMEVRTDSIRFDDIAGYDNAKTALRRKIKGKRPPGVVLWCDELEKAFAGNNGDLSGVTQDQVGVFLTWMQDRLNADQLSAMLLVGFPGTGKSAISMATHNEADCECIRLDMGAMKGSLVGESERKIRRVLKTIDALCKGHVLMLATCNSIAGLPSAFVSRCAFGTYFFNLPDAKENAVLWALKRKKYGIDAADKEPKADGWTGREINQCCFLASDMGISLIEAAKYIAPFCKSGIQEIESLCRQAQGRWLSASHEGLYQTNSIEKVSRSIKLGE